MCTGFIECMRCDHLTPAIFRASGSKFRVTVRAISARDSTHDRQQAQSRENAKRAASAACSCASIVESRTDPLRDYNSR